MVNWKEIKLRRQGYLKALLWVKGNMYDNLGKIESEMLDDSIEKYINALKELEDD